MPNAILSATEAYAQAIRLQREGRTADAVTSLERALLHAQHLLPAHGLLATMFIQLGRLSDAEMTIAMFLKLACDDADACDSLAHASLLLGKYVQARSLYRRAVDLAPANARLWYNLASSERSFGALARAEECCDRAIALDTTQFQSYLLRSELQVQTAAANHVDELQKQLRRPDLDDRARILLGYALGKELDDLGEFDEAFCSFSFAATIRRRRLAYDVEVDVKKLRRIEAAFPANIVRDTSPDRDSDRNVFIVGLPRSGTTLVERIISGHPGVVSNGETDNFSRALLSCAPEDGADIFSRAAAADPRRVAAQYCALAGVSRSAVRVVEKLPMNYLYLGAIYRALPRAALLVVQRSPIDACFAMYRTLFGVAYPFTYDFEDLARYFAAYKSLVDHWRMILGDKLHEVVYDELISAPTVCAAAAVRQCGLTWSPEALDVAANTAVSMTASAAQVRRPIYGTSSGRWRHYRAHLGPLLEALRRQGIALPSDA